MSTQPFSDDVDLLDLLREIVEDAESIALTEGDLWACTHRVIEQHQGNAPAFAAARVSDRIASGNIAGFRFWQAIAIRVRDVLNQPELRPGKLH